MARTYFDWTAACRRTPSRSKVLRSSTCDKQERQEKTWTTLKQPSGTPSYLSFSRFSGFLAWLWRLWSVFCSRLPNRAFSSFALRDKKRNQRENGGGGGVPQREEWGRRPSHLSRQVLGSESSPRHMLSAGWSPSEWSSSAQRVLGPSVLPVGGRLLIRAPLCDVVAPGQWPERSRRHPGDFLTQILSQLKGHKRAPLFLF